MEDPRTAGTSHLGVEIWHGGKRYHLAKYGPNWVVNLGSQSSHPSPDLAQALLEATGGEPINYVTDDDSAWGVIRPEEKRA